MSELRTNRIVPRDGLPSGSSGGIIQVKMGTFTDRFNTTSSTMVDTGLSVSITPKFSTSKILVSCYVTHSCTVDNIAMFALYDNTNSQYVAGQNDDGHFGMSNNN